MGRKFTIFALFYFVFESKFHVQAPRRAYIWRGDLTEGFLRYDCGGLIFGGAYFRNFTVFPLRGKVVLTKNIKIVSVRISEKSFTLAFIRGWIHFLSIFVKRHVDVICHTR